MEAKKSHKKLLLIIIPIAIVLLAIVFLLPVDYMECGPPQGCDKPSESNRAYCNAAGCAKSWTTIWRKMTGGSRIYKFSFDIFRLNA